VCMDLCCVCVCVWRGWFGVCCVCGVGGLVCVCVCVRGWFGVCMCVCVCVCYPLLMATTDNLTLLKMDVEGAEFETLESLADAELLSHIDQIGWLRDGRKDGSARKHIHTPIHTPTKQPSNATYHTDTHSHMNT